MKKTFSHSITVEQSPAEVYDFLIVPHNHTTFVPNLVQFATDPPGQAWQVGRRAEGKRKVLGQTVTETGTLVEAVPNERIVWDAEVMNFSARGMFSMEPHGDGSRVTLSSEMDVNLLMQGLQALGVGDPDQAMLKVLNALKQRLNSLSSSAATAA